MTLLLKVSTFESEVEFILPIVTAKFVTAHAYSPQGLTRLGKEYYSVK
ncbi:hypothetical protein SAMN05518672_115118 [Chitinophaga sp. CF118]|nr:hypothetical protein SAMN05518672_115118 [Chitinophaga sp. CF118]